MKPNLDARGAHGAQSVARMVSNFQAELEHMYAEMKEHMPGANLRQQSSFGIPSRCSAGPCPGCTDHLTGQGGGNQTPLPIQFDAVTDMQGA